MKVQMQSYGAGAYNAEEEETSALYYRIDHRFNEPAEARIVVADPDGSKAQKYVVDSYKDLVAAIADDGGAFTDETTEAGEDTADDMTLLPGVPAVNDAYYFAFSESTIGCLTLNVTTAGVGTWTITWEYYNGSWTALAGVSDGTTGFTVAGAKVVSWTVPADWTATTVNSQGPFYYVRARVSAYTNINAQPLGGQAWYALVWPGPAKVTIEDPDATDIFFGRLIKTEADRVQNTLTMYAQDWLSQLDEEQITYDMREDLDGSGTRSSVILSDYDDTDGNGINPAYNNAGTYYVYDHDIGLTADAHNGMYFIMEDSMAGNITVKTGPYSYTGDASTAEAFDNDISDVWIDDSNKHTSVDVGGGFYDLWKFKVWTPDSGFFVSCSAARINMTIAYAPNADITLFNGATYDTLDEDIGTTGTAILRKTFTVPEQFLAGMFDANGEVWVKLTEAAASTINTYFIEVECDFVTTGYSSATAISDGETYRLTVATDFSADAQKIWDGLPYCVAQEIYKHIDTAESGTLVSDGDVLQAITSAAGIEHTSGISTRRYQDATRFEILQDLAIQDKAEFYMALGTATLTWKSTWGANSNTFTDASCIGLTMTQDYTKLANEFNIYGMRIGDRQLYSNTTDSTSITEYGQTRSQTRRETGLVSQYDTAARGTALVNQYKDILKMLTATIPGLDSNYRLGTITEVTSSKLGISAVDYIVDSWSYDSRTHRSMITLHPKVSTTGLQKIEIMTSAEKATAKYLKGIRDKYIPEPESNVL